jgi:hypothetical protein
VLKQVWSGRIGGFMPGFVAALFVAAALSATPASAQPEIFPTAGITWTVQPAFGQSGEGRDNVSGATCVTIPLVARTPCLVVNDSTNFAQIFSVVGTTINPAPRSASLRLRLPAPWHSIPTWKARAMMTAFSMS